MHSATHAAIGGAIVSIFYPTTDAIAVAVIASQLPDIDSTESAIGAMVYPLARWLESWGHRGFTHSLLCFCLVSLCAIAVTVYYFKDSTWGIAASVGYLSSIIADCFTKQGCQLLWPWRVWCVVGLNPNRRLKSGSIGEIWIVLVAVLILVFSLQVQGFEGISLTLPSNKSDVFLKYPTYCILSDLKVKKLDQSIVAGKYLAVSIDSFWRPGESFTTANSSIISVKYTPVKDCKATTVKITFVDENSLPLHEFIGQYAFVFGRVQSDETILGGGSFFGEPIGQAIDAIGNAWITGELSVKVYKELIDL